MDPTIARSLDALAREQHGCMTYAQMDAIGLSRSTRARRIRDGALIPAGRSTVRVASAPRTPESVLMAACLSFGGRASHRSAWWLHGLGDSGPPTPEITVCKGRPARRPPEGGPLVVHTSTSLPSEDLTVVRGIPTVSVARCLLGLAALVPHGIDREALTSSVETAVRARRASDAWLWWLLENRRRRGWNGVSELERVLAIRAGLGPTESWLEREALAVIAAAGLPAPVVQRRIARRGRFIGRVDLAYEQERVAIELMGHRDHSSRPQLEADTRRATDLQLSGWLVIQVTYDQLVSDPESVVASIREALASAALRRSGTF